MYTGVQHPDFNLASGLDAPKPIWTWSNSTRFRCCAVPRHGRKNNDSVVKHASGKSRMVIDPLWFLSRLATARPLAATRATGAVLRLGSLFQIDAGDVRQRGQPGQNMGK